MLKIQLKTCTIIFLASFFIVMSTSADTIYCNNPNCPKKHKKYASERAFSMHLHHSESCNSFFLRHYVSNDCTTNRKNSLFSNDWENHIEFTSSLPKKALQRQFVNVVDPSLFCSNLLPLAQDDDMETSLQFETNSEASSEAAISNTSFPPACVHNHCPPNFSTQEIKNGQWHC